jgi:hypothetical protein
VRSLDTEITIRGTPEQVWSVLTDFAKYPEWNPFIRGASGEAKTGARLKVRIHPPGERPMTFRPTVREASPRHELRWLGHLWLPGLFDGKHVFRIESAGVGQTLFRQSERFRGILVPLFPNAMYEQIRRGFEAMNRALRETVEKQRDDQASGGRKDES